MTAGAEPQETAAPARRLVVVYGFPPYADTSGISAAKRVRQRGEPVDVIQNKMDRLRARDTSLETVVAEHVRRRCAVDSKATFSGWPSIASFCDKGLRTALRWEAEAGSGPYRSMYSRVHFPAPHFLAARYKMVRPQVHWEAEFSDPVWYNSLGKERYSPAAEGELLHSFRGALLEAGVEPPDSDNVYLWCEYLAFALADTVLFTNAGQRDYMLGLCPDRALAERAAAKAVVAGHPTLPASFYELAEPPVTLEPGKVHIGYFGNFYASQSAQPLLEALAGLGEGDRSRLQLHVFSGQPKDLPQQVEAMGLEGTVLLEPVVEYLDFLALTRRMDVLLALDYATPPNADANPFLVSKWSDYAGSGTPVWGVVDEGSPMDAKPLAHRSPLKHVTAAQQVLQSLARDQVRAGPAGSAARTARG